MATLMTTTHLEDPIVMTMDMTMKMMTYITPVSPLSPLSLQSLSVLPATMVRARVAPNLQRAVVALSPARERVAPNLQRVRAALNPVKVRAERVDQSHQRGLTTLPPLSPAPPSPAPLNLRMTMSKFKFECMKMACIFRLTHFSLIDYLHHFVLNSYYYPSFPEPSPPGPAYDDE